MNSKMVLGILASLILTTSAMADENGGPRSGEKEWRHPGGFCKLKLTEDQKSQIKAEHLKFAEEKIDLVAQFKHSKLALKKLMADPKTDFRTAKAAAEEVAKNRAKLSATKSAMRMEIAFKIFTADQRLEAQKCRLGRRHHGLAERGHRPVNS